MELTICSKENGLEGCYECKKLDQCKKGFYKESKDAKVNAMFIKKYGKAKLYYVLELMSKDNDLYTVQQIIENSDDPIKLMEKYLYE